MLLCKCSIRKGLDWISIHIIIVNWRHNSNSSFWKILVKIILVYSSAAGCEVSVRYVHLQSLARLLTAGVLTVSPVAPGFNTMVISYIITPVLLLSVLRSDTSEGLVWRMAALAFVKPGRGLVQPRHPTPGEMKAPLLISHSLCYWRFQCWKVPNWPLPLLKPCP